MLGVYNYTVVLTYLGMLVSFLGVTVAMAGNVRGALICLMISGFCDMFDGMVAATRVRTKSEKRFGVQIDSLSDLICFGVLPSLIVYIRSGRSTLAFYLCALYLLCALIRLAWFNVTEEERQDVEEGPREYYRGLPVTTSALLFPLLYGICAEFRWSATVAGPIVAALMAVAFVTPFPLKKPHMLGKIGTVLCGVLTLTLVLIGADL